MMSDAEGEELVKLARTAVEKYVVESVVIRAKNISILSEKAGIFITLNYLMKNGDQHLRGCVGFPVPEKTLNESIIEASIAAATKDPRFPPLRHCELDRIIFELSILSQPEEIRVDRIEEYQKQIKIGRDGLILSWKYGSGLLLPQVPVEHNWRIDDYLANICCKSGAPLDALLSPESKLYKFQAIIFKEREPRGRVIKVNLE